MNNEKKPAEIVYAGAEIEELASVKAALANTTDWLASWKEAHAIAVKELADAIEWKDRYRRTAHINARDADEASKALQLERDRVEYRDGVIVQAEATIECLRDALMKAEARIKELEERINDMEVGVGEEC